MPQNRPTDPLAFVEIDHTPVDVIVVDEQNRMPLGRPWLSLAVDVATRMIAGFYLSFDAPSALSVAIVLTHTALPKESWLAERKITLPGPVSGIPDWIETDNGEEFHSAAFERGAAEYGIRLTYRPPGKPEASAHIERLIGTFMHRIHLISGTTFSNVAEKDTYDSEARAVMTMKELERWLALEILGVYHKSVHATLRQPPEQTWTERRARRAAPIRHPRDPSRFLLDFLPGERRRIRRNGIRLFNIHYWDDILSPLAGPISDTWSGTTRATCPCLSPGRPRRLPDDSVPRSRRSSRQPVGASQRHACAAGERIEIRRREGDLRNHHGTKGARR